MNLYASNLVVLFPIGCCLYIAMRMTDARRDHQATGPAKAAIYTVAVLLILISLTGLLLRNSPLNLLWLVGLGLVGALLLIKSTILGRSAILLSFNSNGTSDEQLRMAGDFVRLNSGWVRRRARRLYRALAQGTNWSVALQQSGIAKSEHEILWCRLADRYGPIASQEMPSSIHPLRIQTEIERIFGRLAVLPWLLQCIPIVGYIGWAILPTFQEMLDEFQMTSLSAANNLALLEQIWQFPFNFAMLTLIVFGFIFSELILVLLFFPQLKQYIPFRWFFSEYYRAIELLTLSAAARRESTLLAACQSASELVPSPKLSRRIRTAADMMTKGASPGMALRTCNVLNKEEAQLLENGTSTLSLSWALQQIALSQSEKMLRRLSLFTQISVILIILTFASLYGMVAYCMIDFISQMILHLSR